MLLATIVCDVLLAQVKGETANGLPETGHLRWLYICWVGWPYGEFAW